MTRTKDATQAIQLAGNDVTNLINRTLANHGYQPLISELTSTNRFNDVFYDKAFTRLVPELKQYDMQYRSWYSQQMSLINSPKTKALKKFLEHDEEYKSMDALSSTDLGALAGYDRDEGFKKMVGGDNLGLGYPSYAAAPTLLATVGTHRFENYLNKALSIKSTQLSRINEGLPVAFTLTNADYSDGTVISDFNAIAIDKSGIKLVKLSGKFKMQVGGRGSVKVTKTEPIESSVLDNLIATLRSYKPVFRTRIVDIPTNFGPFENYHKLIEAVSHAIVFDNQINDL